MYAPASVTADTTSSVDAATNVWTATGTSTVPPVSLPDSYTVIIIIIKGIYIAQVRKGHKCAMSAEMAVWLRNCLYLYSYLSHN